MTQEYEDKLLQSLLSEKKGAENLLRMTEGEAIPQKDYYKGYIEGIDTALMWIRFYKQ